MRLYESPVVRPRSEPGRWVRTLEQVRPVGAIFPINRSERPEPITDLRSLRVSPRRESFLASGPTASIPLGRSILDLIEFAGFIDDDWITGALDPSENTGPTCGIFAVEVIEIDVDSRDDLPIRIARHVRPPIVELI